MESELAKRVNRINADIKDLKTEQAIGGDSWIIYRDQVSYTSLANRIYQVDFVPDVAGSFIAKAYLTDPTRFQYGSELSVRPDPNVNGRWYVISTSFGTVDRTVFIYSTKKGTLTLTDLSVPTTL
jgi:hypothetical protein